MAKFSTLVAFIFKSHRALLASAIVGIALAALPMAGQIGAAHARVASSDQAQGAKSKSVKKSKANKRTVRKHSAKKNKAKKSKAKNRSAKKRSTKKRSAKKHSAKKHSAKKRNANKAKAKKRIAKKRKASARKSAKRKVSKRKRVKSAKSRSVKRKKTRVTKKRKARRYVAARPTLGTVFRLHQADDPLKLRSSVAYVFDPDTRQELFSKNSGVVLPIASITKLMTAVVVLDGGQSMREMLTITRADIDRLRGSSSRLSIGTKLSRAEMLQIALMSSANRAANALGRHYPGGLKAFVSAMNAKARMFGMTDTQFADPTGLSGANVSSAKDIARLAGMAHDYPLIRKYSTADGLQVDTGYTRLSFHNTNRLISSESWSIGLQKTGYIAEAGRCLVMVARIDGRNLVMVLLDSNGNTSRFADAQRIRRWLLKDGPGIYAAGQTTTLN